MKAQLIFLPKSLADLDAHGYYIEQDSQATAERFARAFIETANELLRFPEAHAVYDASPMREQQFRRVAIRGFPNHLMFYRLTDEGIEVCRVLHAAMDLPRVFDPDGDMEGQVD